MGVKGRILKYKSKKCERNKIWPWYMTENLWTKRGNKKCFKNVNNKMWVKNVGVKETVN